MDRTLFLTVIVALLKLGNVWCQTYEDGLTLDQCVSITLSQNPLILSSVESHRASLARIDQVRALPPLSIDFNSDMQPQFLNFIDSGEAYYGASYPLEFPGKRSLRAKIADRESQEIATDIEILRLELAYLAKESFYRLLLAQEKSQYAEQDLELSNDFLSKAELKFAAGDVARVEVLRARVEALKAANQVRVALNEQRLSRARLNCLMARRRAAPLKVAGQLRVPFVELELGKLIQEAFSLRPELTRVSFSIEREQFSMEHAQRSLWPDFDLNLSRHYLEGEPTTWSFTVSAPLSFLFSSRQKAESREAEINIAALEREAEHLRDSIRLEVEEAFTSSLTAKDQSQLLQEEILPQAEEAYEMYLFSYQEGEIGGIELIEARRTLNEARKSFADSLFNYATAMAGLEKAVGRQP